MLAFNGIISKLDFTVKHKVKFLRPNGSRSAQQDGGQVSCGTDNYQVAVNETSLPNDFLNQKHMSAMNLAPSSFRQLVPSKGMPSAKGIPQRGRPSGSAWLGALSQVPYRRNRFAGNQMMKTPHSRININGDYL